MADTRVLSRMATDILKRDHRMVLQLFDDYVDLGREDAEEKQELFEKIKEELTHHAQIEEEIFYPALEPARAKDASDLLQEAREDHEKVKELLRELSGLNASDEEFDELMDTLCESVKSHADDEEKELFKLFKKLAKERQDEVSRRLAERKRELSGGIS